MQNIIFIDSEVGLKDKKIHDIGAVRFDGTVFHSPNLNAFADFLSGAEFLCGHNIIHHDLKYLGPALAGKLNAIPIDTLYLSPLLFPKRPYHNLLKDDKLQTEELNNPVNDSKKAQALFFDEVNAFFGLPERLKQIFYELLGKEKEFRGFFVYTNYKPDEGAFSSFLRSAGLQKSEKAVAELIREEFHGLICENAEVEFMIREYPKELAYTLALIHTRDFHSLTPPWLLKNFPEIENIIKLLCNTLCAQNCLYCREKLNIYKGLKNFFGFDGFRVYNGEPLQEYAARAAIEDKSLLAVFPTGGGKSLTFQLPALISGEAAHGLTVVISPLQSLMKDQVDNLNDLGITGAVTVNGLLSPVERADALRRVADGSATLLYISPESLRSRTIESKLLARNIIRFVIDEAHCFSSWGQDFRVDYLYIADFIARLQRKKGGTAAIPVSCFTATAKRKVISDICEYFNKNLGLELEIFASSAERENLQYRVLYREDENEKYNSLRSLIEQKNCPTIVYVSRVKRTYELAERLSSDGFYAKPFNGKMESREKIEIQDAFINNDISVIVATSAFGMGVDKKDVGLVVHYDISDSLENYIQESGRAGRDPSSIAECYVLYNDDDLNRHFLLLNQTKLSISEIQQLYRAIKRMGGKRLSLCSSALEIAREAGWDSSVSDVETRVRTAISALENAGYVKRGLNMPRVYATGILAENMQEAARKIDASSQFPENMKADAKRIIKSLISARSIAEAGNADAESRVDYLADELGLPRKDVIEIVNIMRLEGILADTQDMSAYIYDGPSARKSTEISAQFLKLEELLLSELSDNCINEIHLKELNERAEEAGIKKSSEKNLRTILYFLAIKHYIKKGERAGSPYVRLKLLLPKKELLAKFELRKSLCRYIVCNLYERAKELSGDEKPVSFSLVKLHKDYCEHELFSKKETSLSDVEDALLYLSKIGALKLEGGFLVLYNAMDIRRLVSDNTRKYKADDYKQLNEFYSLKIQQIHIVGEFANMIVRDYDEALRFVHDYFNIEYREFISKYFKGERKKEIECNITPKKYKELFSELSAEQLEIINDNESKYIAVVAGPGSGKTRVLVHKLAALLLLEEVKHEQLLMLTFSRAAATEFKKRLWELIGNAANFVEIKTFHSYCFDLLGKIGSLEGSDNVVSDAVRMIRNGETEPGKIIKSVLVIDEAQDMDKNEFNLIRALMNFNDEMRVIAVGDDDQNIYEFRGSNSAHLRRFADEYGAQRYELDDNYRSKANIVRLANEFIRPLPKRMKHNDIRAVSNEAGIVRLVSHNGKHFEEAVVNNLIKTHTDGTAGVLTNTNEEALCILGLLLQRGIHAKLIQSTDGFSLYNLAEIRFFLKRLLKNSNCPVISQCVWNKAKEHLKKKYKDSSCLENCLNMLSDFEKVYPIKYKSDLDEFIRESKYEDFYANEKGAVYVSTIHKSKGREFDEVYMLLDSVSVYREEARRTLYVGMTRAKSALYIHYNNGLFDEPYIAGIEKTYDCASYPESEKIVLQLTHRDVMLDFFADKKSLIFELHSGSPLIVRNSYFYAKIDGVKNCVGKFSKACLKRLKELNAKGYTVYNAEVRFIVAWKGEEDTEETAVILPTLYLNKI